MGNKCDSQNTVKTNDGNLNRNQNQLRSEGAKVLAGNEDSRGDRYKQVFVYPGVKNTWDWKTEYTANDIINFKKTASPSWTDGKTPYDNEAHHIFICEVISSWYEKDKSGYRKTILEKGAYDLNHGLNNIFLPHEYRDIEIHLLPVHRGHHPECYDEQPWYKEKRQYRDDMDTELKKMSANFKKPKDCKNDPNDYSQVQKTLNEASGRLFKRIAKIEYRPTMGYTNKFRQKEVNTDYNTKKENHFKKIINRAFEIQNW